MRLLDTFSGIGGFSLGMERAGFQTVGFCEPEKYCQEVLAQHWPEVPIYDDIRELSAERLAGDGIGGISVISGGFPCQDISKAGSMWFTPEGTAGKRSGLWAELCRLISEVRPRYAIMENVPNLLVGDSGQWFGRLLGDLASIRYNAEWHCIPATAIGAPHYRNRVWIIAYPNEPGLQGRGETGDSGEEGPQPRFQFTSRCSRVSRGVWETEPGIRRVANGIPRRIHRIKALGNSIVPQIAEMIGQEIFSRESGQQIFTSGTTR